MGGALAVSLANRGAQVGWIAPTYKNARPLWAAAKRYVAPVAHLLRVLESEREILFPGGGRLAVFSGDNPDAMRGSAFHLVIGDEASRLSEETYADVILPTLSDYAGHFIAITTPRGKNWFYREWTKAKHGASKDSAAFTAPTSDNPMPTIQRAAELARGMVSERTYRQEWLAEFVDDGGLLFRNVRACATSARLEAPVEHASYAAGIDWAGTGEDSTVLTILDMSTSSEVYKDRFNGLDWGMSEERIAAALERWNVEIAYGEDNGFGSVMNNRLRARNLRVRNFHTSHASKAQIIEALVGAFERREIRILNDSETLMQLEAFESTRLPSGEYRYAAPEGMHDDDVMSMALAWRASSGRAFSFG